MKEFREKFYLELKNRVNQDNRFVKAVKDVSLRVLYIIIPDENFPHLQMNLFEIENGKIKDIKIIDFRKEVKADVIIKIYYSDFLKIALGKKKVSIRDLLKGKVKVKGLALLRKFKDAFDIISKHLIKFATELKGKIVLLMERNDIYLPNIHIGEWSRDFLSNISGKVLLISDEGIRKAGLLDDVQELLSIGDAEVFTFTNVESEPSVETLEKCYSLAEKIKPNVVIGFGGGSPMDTAKAVSIMIENKIDIKELDPTMNIRREKVKLILIPTTSGSGSEATWISMIRDRDGRKLVLAHRAMLPDLVIIDPFFVKTLPKSVIVTSGLDALTHAIESMLGWWSNEFVYNLAIRSLKLIIENLPKSYKGDEKAREMMHYASHLAGIAAGNSQATLSHGLGHAIGSVFNIPHGIAVSVVLPYVLQYYSERDDLFERLLSDLGMSSLRDLAEKVKNIIKSVDGSTSLAELIEEDLFYERMEKVIDLVEEDPTTYMGPRLPTREELKMILEKAYIGKDIDF